MTLAPQTLVLLVLTPLIVWRMYSRIRRMVGRQKSSPRRQWMTVCLFPLLTVFLGVGAAVQPYALLALFGGVALGVLMGVVGHRLTRFEQTDQGLYYTPNAHLGIIVSLLFIGRIFYRFATIGSLSHAAAAQQTGSSPLTLAVYGMMAGYYVAYAVGLILWRRGVERSNPERIGER